MPYKRMASSYASSEAALRPHAARTRAPCPRPGAGCGAEVVRQLGEMRLLSGGVDRFKRLADLLVEPQPPHRRQLVVERVPDQSVTEAKPAGRSGHLADKALGHGLLQHLQHVGAGESAKPREHVEAELPAHDRGGHEKVPACSESRATRWPITARTPGGILSWASASVMTPRRRAAAPSRRRTAGSPPSRRGSPHSRARARVAGRGSMYSATSASLSPRARSERSGARAPARRAPR